MDIPESQLTNPETMKETILHIITTLGLIKRGELLIRLKLSYPELKDRRMRLLIMELIRDGYPIASSEKGYSIIQNVRELTEAVNYMKRKAKSISLRANCLIANYDQIYQDAPANLQMKLF